MNGDYFVWLSHDDVLRPYKIEAQLKAIVSSGSKETISQGNYSYINESSGGVVDTCFEKFYPEKMLKHGCLLFLWGETHFSNMLFSVSHFDRVGLFDEDNRTAQDQDMQFRLLKGQETVFLKEPVSLFRLHGKSGSIRKKNLMFEENRSLYVKILKNLPDEEILQSSGNIGAVYAHIAAIIHSMGGGKELQEVEKMLQKEFKPFR